MPGSISYSAGLIGSPFAWAFLSALFLGAALQRATRRPRPRFAGEDLDRARNAKWILFSLLLCLSIVAALGALFVPGPEKIKDIRLLYFYLACTVLFFLAFRFKRSFGIITLVLLLALVTAVALFVQSLTAFTGETEIGRVRVLASRENQMKLEIITGGREPAVHTMAGSYFAPVVKVVIFDDYFVFLGSRTWYRFTGLTSFAVQKGEAGQSFRQQDTDYYFPASRGISEKLWSFYERHEARIPGVKSVQVEMDLKKARELATYSLRIQNDGGLEIVELD